jgi:phage-related protein
MKLPRMAAPDLKPIQWMGDAKERLLDFPEAVRKEVGYALYFAQAGDKHTSAKPLKGFGGAGVLEIVENRAGDAYRVVYTVKFGGTVYVLHCFQKKSKRASATPKADIDLIKKRLRAARQHHTIEEAP